MYFVTGVSRGLGQAITELLLENGESVCGIGRRHSFEHKNFSFIECDLNSVAGVEELQIDVPKGEVTLINNAGIIGEIGRLSDGGIDSLESVLNVNTITPMILAMKIYNSVSDKNQFRLVNISSGAANRAIPSWASYCASKAAINMLSETFYLEEHEKGFQPKVYAVAPGVIDTDMQKQIRAASKDEFSSLENFIALKEEGKLYAAETAAKKLLTLLDSNYEGVFADLREIDA